MHFGQKQSIAWSGGRAFCRSIMFYVGWLVIGEWDFVRLIFTICTLFCSKPTCDHQTVPTTFRIQVRPSYFNPDVRPRKEHKRTTTPLDTSRLMAAHIYSSCAEMLIRYCHALTWTGFPKETQLQKCTGLEKVLANSSVITCSQFYQVLQVLICHLCRTKLCRRRYHKMWSVRLTLLLQVHPYLWNSRMHWSVLIYFDHIWYIW